MLTIPILYLVSLKLELIKVEQIFLVVSLYGIFVIPVLIMVSSSIYGVLIFLRSCESSMLEIGIKRGKESWMFIYFVLGILLAIELFFVSLLGVDTIWKSVLGGVISAFIIYLCLLNAWFQNKIIGLKTKIENNWKKIK